MYITNQDLINCGIDKNEEELKETLAYLNRRVKEIVVSIYEDVYCDNGYDEIHAEFDKIPNHEELAKKEAAYILGCFREQRNDLAQFITDDVTGDRIYAVMRISSNKFVKIDGGRIKNESDVFQVGDLSTKFITSFSNGEISFKIPEGVTHIAVEVFSPLYILQITSPDAPANINDLITSITLPSSLRVIEYAGFCGYENLRTINLPEGLEKIGYAAFHHCRKLTALKIPSTVTELETAFFPGNIEPDGIIIKNNPVYTITDGVIFANNGTELHTYLPANKRKIYAVPDGVTEIKSGAFGSCKNLSEVIIPDSVISVGDCAFSGCDNLKKITYPERLKEHIVKSGWAYYKIIVLKERLASSDLGGDMSINDLDFSVRTYNCLFRAGLYTIGDIIKLTENDLSGIRNLGNKGIAEVIGTLAELGFSLCRDEDDPEH